MSLEWSSFYGRYAKSPNDPKLSDGGAWRGSCEGGAQKEATDVGQRPGRTGRARARIAATVTRGAVRCSAWLNQSLREAVLVKVVVFVDGEMLMEQARMLLC